MVLSSRRSEILSLLTTVPNPPDCLLEGREQKHRFGNSIFPDYFFVVFGRVSFCKSNSEAQNSGLPFHTNHYRTDSSSKYRFDSLVPLLDLWAFTVQATLAGNVVVPDGNYSVRFPLS